MNSFHHLRLKLEFRRCRIWLTSFLILIGIDVPHHAATNLAFHSTPHSALRFHGFVGERIRLTAENWLQPAPFANPGMLEMFKLRDRQPTPRLVPWAGEFVGKYLISAIQARRLGASVPDLSGTVAELIASQAEDGYLGPFPKNERLLGNWDLWGHYHCMLALLMWHEQTGDRQALDCVKRAADLVCNIYLDTGKRAIDAGSDEMNLSIIHALGWLYRETNEDRYLRMMREIEKDWERGGDFVRTGLAGMEFFQTPRPRWEGLHSLQGLVELYRITGDEKYRRAFEHHWRSIARWDLRNTGGFSSGEQATGNPYAPTPIETCCSIAWMALSLDMLKLTGDPRVADLLELATLNAWAGAQHPSGRWCTYNTPMDGAREASAHSIVFQSRAGTPELNCCSVNGPRGWSMLADWAVMQAEDGYVINWLGPFAAAFPTTNTTTLTGRYLPRPGPQPARPSQPQIQIAGDYPSDPNVTIRIELEHAEEFTLRVRIPAWSKKTLVKLNDDDLPNPEAGSYLTIRRKWSSHWRKTDILQLTLDLQPRFVPGAREALGKVSVYRGPLLLAWDQRFNEYDEALLPSLDPSKLPEAQWTIPARHDDARKNERIVSPSKSPRLFDPLVLCRIPGRPDLNLCDFASAGALGTRYRSWLTATNSPPSPVVTRQPRDGVTLAPGRVAFRWTGLQKSGSNSCSLEISRTKDFAQPILGLDNLRQSETLVDLPSNLKGDQPYYWRVISHNEVGSTSSTFPAAVFFVNPKLPPANETLTVRELGPNGEIVRASIQQGTLDGISQRLIYPVGDWPEEDYSAEVRFKLLAFPTNRIGQIFSAWAGSGDDPLRITIDKGRIFARIEMGNSYSTEGFPIELDRWYKVSAVKKGTELRLYVDGKSISSCTVPQFITTRALDFGLGGNPHYAGNEFLQAEFSDICFSTTPP